MFIWVCVCVCVYLLCWWPESCWRLFKLICVNRDSGMEGRGRSIICLSAASLLWSESSGHVPSPCGPLQIRTGPLSSAFWGKSLHPCTSSPPPLTSILSISSSVQPRFTLERPAWPHTRHPSVHHSSHPFVCLIFWPIHPFSSGMNTTNPLLPSWGNGSFWNLPRKNLKWVSISFCAGPWELWFPKCSSE